VTVQQSKQVAALASNFGSNYIHGPGGWNRYIGGIDQITKALPSICLHNPI
jgi:hypothetical protein